MLDLSACHYMAFYTAMHILPLCKHSLLLLLFASVLVIGTCSVLCPDGYPCACHTSDSSPAANCLGCYTPSEYHCTPSGLQSGTGQNTAGQCSNSGL